MVRLDALTLAELRAAIEICRWDIAVAASEFKALVCLAAYRTLDGASDADPALPTAGAPRTV